MTRKRKREEEPFRKRKRLNATLLLPDSSEVRDGLEPTIVSKNFLDV